MRMCSWQEADCEGGTLCQSETECEELTTGDRGNYLYAECRKADNLELSLDVRKAQDSA